VSGNESMKGALRTDVVRAGGRDPFDYVEPTAEQMTVMLQVRAGFRALANVIQTSIPVSRERSLALTKLEEAAMWANKAIVYEAPR
jgi:hypothetical protein